jgi:hypothetical protein
MSNINNIISDRRTNSFKIIDHNGNDVLEVDSNNELKIGRGANKQTLCNNSGVPQMGGAGSPLNEIRLGNGLAHCPIIVKLPCRIADFPHAFNNLLLTMDASGFVRPISSSDIDKTLVIGVTNEVVSSSMTEVDVQIGGIIKMTPHYGQVCTAGKKLERSNQGPPYPSPISGFVAGVVQTNGLGTGICAQALTSGTGSADGSVKILALWNYAEIF